MELDEMLKTNKRTITTYLDELFKRKRSKWDRVNRWGLDVLDRLQTFMSGGKMVRGSLVLWSASALSDDDMLEKALPAAAAVEFLQAALLVHDDIIDKDDTRRGKPSIHNQYERHGVESECDEPAHFGTSMAICLGDLAFFLAYEQLALLGDADLVTLFSNNTSIVGLGQMEDVAWGHERSVPELADILSMYEHKTAMYTFSLPFMLGASIASADCSVVEGLERLGSALGQLFQLRDDQLGLYATSETMGKSIGLDIVTGKKTPYYSLLISKASSQEKRFLQSLQKKSFLDKSDLDAVHQLLDRHGISTAIETTVERLTRVARETIDDLDVTTAVKRELYDLVSFVKERTT